MLTFNKNTILGIKKGVQKSCVMNKTFLLGQPCLFTLQFIMLLYT